MKHLNAKAISVAEITMFRFLTVNSLHTNMYLTCPITDYNNLLSNKSVEEEKYLIKHGS